MEEHADVPDIAGRRGRMHGLTCPASCQVVSTRRQETSIRSDIGIGSASNCRDISIGEWIVSSAIAGQMYSETEVRVTATNRTVDSTRLQLNYQNRRRQRQHGLFINALIPSTFSYSLIMQAEQKTVPTNAMKELRIEKLVISTFVNSCSVGSAGT